MIFYVRILLSTSSSSPNLHTFVALHKSRYKTPSPSAAPQKKAQSARSRRAQHFPFQPCILHSLHMYKRFKNKYVERKQKKPEQDGGARKTHTMNERARERDLRLATTFFLSPSTPIPTRRGLQKLLGASATSSLASVS